MSTGSFYSHPVYPHRHLISSRYSAQKHWLLALHKILFVADKSNVTWTCCCSSSIKLQQQTLMHMKNVCLNKYAIAGKQTARKHQGDTYMKACDFSTCSKTGSKQHETELKGKQDETRLESNTRAQK